MGASGHEAKRLTSMRAKIEATPPPWLLQNHSTKYGARFVPEKLESSAEASGGAVEIHRERFAVEKITRDALENLCKRQGYELTETIPCMSYAGKLKQTHDMLLMGYKISKVKNG